jgi:hypothetical protein
VCPVTINDSFAAPSHIPYQVWVWLPNLGPTSIQAPGRFWVAVDKLKFYPAANFTFILLDLTVEGVQTISSIDSLAR